MAGQLCPLCARPIEPGENVAFREGTLRHMRCIDAGVPPVRPADTASDGLPSCAVCAQPVTIGEDVVALTSGRVEHPRCSSLTCGICSQRILADEAARHFRGEEFHEGCWVRRARTIAAGGGAV
jgi:hypothetical protein